MDDKAAITRILRQQSQGEQDVYDELLPLVYNKLHDIAGMRMRREDYNHTYSKTDLVHEAYFKLIEINQVDWKDRAHFFAIASRCMRRILIDYARKKKAAKRGGEQSPSTYIDHLYEAERQAEWLIDLDTALNELGELNERLASVVECRYFGEMSIKETAQALDISTATVKRDWKKAKGWLYRRLKDGFEESAGE